MVIENLLKNVELPAIYKREGKDCYYDTYRKKLIEITPEETIRQKVASLFEHQYGVPKSMILVEVPMSYYKLIYSFIEYALLREEVRRRKKKER